MEPTLLWCLVPTLLYLSHPAAGQARIQITSIVRARYAVTTVKAPFTTGSVPEDVIFETDLPLEAFISGFSITTNGQKCEAEIKESDTAFNDFDTGLAAGHTVGLTTHREGPGYNSFESQVRIKEDSTGFFELTYEHQVNRKDDDPQNPYLLTIPVSTFSSPFNRWSVKIDIMEDSPFDTTEQNVDFYVVDQSHNEVQHGDNFKKDVRSLAINNKIFYFDGNVTESASSHGTFSVSYTLNQGRRQVETFVSEEQVAALISPNPALNRDPGLDIMVLLDTSGSMNDEGKLGITMEAVAGTMLKGLKEEDQVTFIQFHTDVVTLGTFTGGRRDRREARKALAKVTSRGWTDIHGALSKALDLADEHIQRGSTETPLIVMYTDGKPQGAAGSGIKTNEQEIREGIRRRNTRCIPIYSMAIGEEADHDFVKDLSHENCGETYRLPTDNALIASIEDILEKVKVPIYSTLPQITVTSDCVDQSKVENDLKKLSGKKFANSSDFELINIPFTEGISLRQPCEVEIVFTANVQNQPVREEIKICLPEGRKKYSRFTKLSSLSQSCPTRIRPGRSGRIPKEDFLERLREYREIKKSMESFDYDRTSLVDRAKKAKLVVGDLTALVVVVSANNGVCEPVTTATDTSTGIPIFSIIDIIDQPVINQPIRPIKPIFPGQNQNRGNDSTSSFGDQTGGGFSKAHLYCELEVCDKSGFRGNCYLTSRFIVRSWPKLSHADQTLGLGPDEVASMRITETGFNPGSCAGFTLYTEENYAGDSKHFPPGEYQGFQELGDFFQETRSIKVIEGLLF